MDEKSAGQPPEKPENSTCGDDEKLLDLIAEIIVNIIMEEEE